MTALEATKSGPVEVIFPFQQLNDFDKIKVTTADGKYYVVKPSLQRQSGSLRIALCIRGLFMKSNGDTSQVLGFIDTLKKDVKREEIPLSDCMLFLTKKIDRSIEFQVETIPWDGKMNYVLYDQVKSIAKIEKLTETFPKDTSSKERKT